MAFLLNLFLLEELQELYVRNTMKIKRRRLRDASDPFDATDRFFIQHYRLSKDLVRNLILELRPHIRDRQRINGVSIEIKVFVALYFFAHGSYQKCVGINFNFGVERSKVSRIITEITNAMTANLMNRWIVFPQTEEARNSVKLKFSEKFHIPGVIGAIDCTHIAIVAPSSNDPVRPGIVYYNRKGYYSLNVQLICDANLKIIACNARFPGSCHDSAIWSLSIVRQHIEQQYLSGNLHSSWLIGDSGYGLQPWLLTPIVDAEANSPEDRYTRCQMSARNTVERCIGVLKQKFRCLLKHRVLHYDPVKSAKIVYCCAMLHNMSLHTQNLAELDIENNEEPEIELDIENHEDPAIPQHNNNNENWYAEGQQTRRQLIENYFT